MGQLLTHKGSTVKMLYLFVFSVYFFFRLIYYNSFYTAPINTKYTEPTQNIRKIILSHAIMVETQLFPVCVIN